MASDTEPSRTGRLLIPLPRLPSLFSAVQPLFPVKPAENLITKNLVPLQEPRVRPQMREELVRMQLRKHIFGPHDAHKSVDDLIAEANKKELHHFMAYRLVKVDDQGKPVLDPVTKGFQYLNKPFSEATKAELENAHMVAYRTGRLLRHEATSSELREPARISARSVWQQTQPPTHGQAQRQLLRAMMDGVSARLHVT